MKKWAAGGNYIGSSLGQRTNEHPVLGCSFAHGAADMVAHSANGGNAIHRNGVCSYVPAETEECRSIGYSINWDLANERISNSS